MPKPEKTAISGWVPISHERAARRLAKQRGVTLAQWIAEAVAAAIAHAEAEPERVAQFTEATTERIVAAVAGVASEEGT